MPDKEAVVLALYVSPRWVVLLGGVHSVSICSPLSSITLSGLPG